MSKIENAILITLMFGLWNFVVYKIAVAFIG